MPGSDKIYHYIGYICWFIDFDIDESHSTTFMTGGEGGLVIIILTITGTCLLNFYFVVLAYWIFIWWYLPIKFLYGGTCLLTFLCLPIEYLFGGTCLLNMLFQGKAHPSGRPCSRRDKERLHYLQWWWLRGKTLCWWRQWWLCVLIVSCPGSLVATLDFRSLNNSRHFLTLLDQYQNPDYPYLREHSDHPVIVISISTWFTFLKYCEKEEEGEEFIVSRVPSILPKVCQSYHTIAVRKVSLSISSLSAMGIPTWLP